MMMVLAAGWLCLGVATAQTAANLTIVSGNGQVVCQFCTNGAPIFYQPMVVEATDPNGNPLAGVTVNWAIASGTGVFQQSGTNSFSGVTDSNGASNATFTVSNPLSGGPGFSVSQSAITASSGSLAVTFYETQALQNQFSSSQIPPINASSNLIPGFTFSGQLGTTSQNPITVSVTDQTGSPVANVGVFVVNAQSNGANIACAGTPGAGPGIVLTDSRGQATCFLTFGGTPGTGLLWLDVGGVPSTVIQPTPPNFPTSQYFIFPSNFYNVITGAVGGYAFTVTPGTPGNTLVVSGNGQTASPGLALAAPLVAQVSNSSGQPLAGVPVTWTVSPANAANLASTTTTGTNGQTSNNVTLTNAATGTITVTASASGTNTHATFTITVTPAVTITGFQIVSGNNQSAVVGNVFSQPLVVQVQTSSGTASGVTVQFRVQGGPVALQSTTAVTNGSGQAQVTAQAGLSPGSATVVASVSGSSQTFNLTVLAQGPNITSANFYNAADLQPNSLSPCSLGQLLGSTLGLANVQPLFPGMPIPPPTSAAVTITFNSIPAPILNIGNNALGQQFVLFQVPCTLSPAASVPTVVNINGATANLNLIVNAGSPGIFHTVMSDGAARAVLVRPDGSYVSLTNPARRGETEVAYVTGLGVTSPAIGTTALPGPGGTPASVLGTVIAGLNGGGVPLVSAQLSEDLAGVYVVAFQIPTDEAQGNNIPFSIGIIPVGGSTAYYSAPTTIPVQ